MRGHRLGLVLWRDAVGLVRAPAEVSSAAFLAVVAVVAGPLDGGPRGLVVLAVLAAYGAATRLVESARREADEPGLASSVLMDRRSLARAHVAVPSLALFLLGAAAAGAAAGLFGISAADLATLVGLSALCWPLVVLGALVAAYKGPTPYATAMLAGQEMGALVLASWAIGGLAFVLVALVPCIEPVLAHDATRRGVVSSELVVGALSYAIGSAWLGRRVRRAGQGAA